MKIPSIEPSGRFQVIGKLRDHLDLSGLDRIGDIGLIVGDEENVAQFMALDLEAGTITPGKVVPTLRGDGELDAEAIAADPESFWITGSHGRGRKSGKLQSERYRVIRLSSEGELMGSGSFSRAFEEDDLLGKFHEKKLKKGGINIEGLAYWNERIYAGLRGPGVEGIGYLISMTPYAVLAESAEHDRHDLELLPGYGIRSLDHCSDGLLILGGASAPGGREPTTVWLWDGQKTTALAELEDLKGKPEGILLLSESPDSLEILVISDGVKHGDPVRFRISR